MLRAKSYLDSTSNSIPSRPGPEKSQGLSNDQSFLREENIPIWGRSRKVTVNEYVKFNEANKTTNVKANTVKSHDVTSRY